MHRREPFNYDIKLIPTSFLINEGMPITPTQTKTVNKRTEGKNWQKRQGKSQNAAADRRCDSGKRPQTNPNFCQYN